MATNQNIAIVYIAAQQVSISEELPRPSYMSQANQNFSTIQRFRRRQINPRHSVPYHRLESNFIRAINDADACPYPSWLPGKNGGGDTSIRCLVLSLESDKYSGCRQQRDGSLTCKHEHLSERFGRSMLGVIR